MAKAEKSFAWGQALIKTFVQKLNKIAKIADLVGVLCNSSNTTLQRFSNKMNQIVINSFKTSRHLLFFFLFSSYFRERYILFKKGLTILYSIAFPWDHEIYFCMKSYVNKLFAMTPIDSKKLYVNILQKNKVISSERTISFL